MSSTVYNILFQSREAKLNNDVAKDLILVLSWGGQDCRLISSYPQVWRRGSSLMPLKSWRQIGRTRWSLLPSSKSSVLIKVAKSKVKQASSPESDLITESWIWLRMITYLNKLLYFCGSSQKLFHRGIVSLVFAEYFNQICLKLECRIIKQNKLEPETQPLIATRWIFYFRLYRSHKVCLLS